MGRESRYYGFLCEHCKRIHGPYSSRAEVMLSQSLHWVLIHPEKDQYTVGWPNSMNTVSLEWLSLRSARFDVEHGAVNASGTCNCTDCRGARYAGSDPEEWPLAVDCKNYKGPSRAAWMRQKRMGQQLRLDVFA